MIDELDYFREKEITCPYCGFKDINSWEFTEPGEVTCGACEKDFFVEVEIDVKYSSQPIDK